jgi:hypothetical protein
VNIDTTFTDLSKDDGDRVGNIMDQYQINFTVKMEFNTAGFYYIIGEDIRDMQLPKIDISDSDLIPVFTDVLLKEDLNLQHGWQLFNRSSIMLEKEDDEINLDQLLDESIIESIKYHINNGLPLYDVIDVRLRRQGQPIHEGVDYSIDWEKRILTFINQNTYFTYSILISINVSYINDLIKKVLNLK